MTTVTCPRCEVELVPAGRANCDACVRELLEAGERVRGIGLSGLERLKQSLPPLTNEEASQ